MFRGVETSWHHLDTIEDIATLNDKIAILDSNTYKGYAKVLYKNKIGFVRYSEEIFVDILKRTVKGGSYIYRDSLMDDKSEKFYIENDENVDVLDIDKTHSNDALAIAIGLHGFGNINPIAIDLINKTYQIKAVRHHNRQIHKMSILKNGIRKLNQLPKYVKNFKLFDKVLYNNTICFIWGRRSSGSFLLKNIDGTKVKDGVGYKYLKLLERSSNYIIN